MNNKTLQNPSAAKYLYYKGYSGKHIAIILGCSLSAAYYYIHDSKVIATDEKLTQSQQLIRYCIDKFRAYTGISTPCFNDDDRIYLQIHIHKQNLLYCLDHKVEVTIQDHIL